LPDPFRADFHLNDTNLSIVLLLATGSGAHPASCSMGTGGPFPGGKSSAGAWRWPLTPSSAEVVSE
jgi:hypothetical protein